MKLINQIRKYYIVLILLTLTTSCSVNRVSYKVEGLKLNGYIPKGFKKKIIQSSHELEYNFEYIDGAKIYITSEGGTPSANYHNIEKDSVALQESFFAYINKDILTLKGVDKKHLYWLNIKLKGGSIGYLNIPKYRLNDFNKAIYDLLDSL